MLLKYEPQITHSKETHNIVLTQLWRVYRYTHSAFSSKSPSTKQMHQT